MATVTVLCLTIVDSVKPSLDFHQSSDQRKAYLVFKDSSDAKITDRINKNKTCKCFCQIVLKNSEVGLLNYIWQRLLCCA